MHASVTRCALAPWRLVDGASACERLQVRLLDLDVQQAQRVQPQAAVGGDAVVKAVRPPGVGEKHDGHGLSEAVKLQPARPDGIHDGGVVHDAHGDAALPCAQLQVGVRRGTKGVAHDQEGHVCFVRALQDGVCLVFDHLAVGNDHRLAIQRLQLDLVAQKDGGVGLQVHARAALDSCQATQADVLIIIQAQPDEVENHGSAAAGAAVAAAAAGSERAWRGRLLVPAACLAECSVGVLAMGAAGLGGAAERLGSAGGGASDARLLRHVDPGKRPQSGLRQQQALAAQHDHKHSRQRHASSHHAPRCVRRAAAADPDCAPDKRPDRPGLAQKRPTIQAASWVRAGRVLASNTRVEPLDAALQQPLLCSR